jgi:diguanylate cyclase (GGDEF)-like protein
MTPILLILLFTGSGVKAKQQIPVALNGVLDLTQWDFEKNGPIELDGQWEYYSKQLLEPKDFGNIHVNSFQNLIKPNSNETENGIKRKRFKPDGYGTYRLKIVLDSPSHAYSLNVFSVKYGGYKLWVNDQLIDSNTIGPNGFYGQKDLSFTSRNNTAYITIQVQKNSRSLFLNKTKLVDQKSDGTLFSQTLLFGSLLVISLYHFVLFIFRRQDKSTFFFGLFCLVIIIYNLFSNYYTNNASLGLNIMVLWIINHWGFFWYETIWYMSISISAYSLTMYIYHLFYEEYSKKLIIAKNFFIIIVLFAGILNSVDYLFSYFGNVYFDIFIVLVLVYGAIINLIILLKAIRNRKEGAILVLIGVVFIAIMVFYDGLNCTGIINTNRKMAVATAIFAIFQSIAIAQRFSKTFSKVENLSERLLVIDKLKDEFLASTSHELRTPVNGIVGISESLIDGAAGKLSKEVSLNLELIVASGKRLASLINDILDFSKLKNHDIALKNNNIDLRQLAGVVITVIKATMSEKDVELINDIPKDLSLVYGDENRIEQILYNIIGNAVKFTKEGYVKVSAKEQDNCVLVTIEDTGIGIPNEKLEDIFISFQQVDSSISREYGGTGLGLGITKQLIELHGGRIWVESEVGKGSKFMFTLQKGVEGGVKESPKLDIKNEKVIKVDIIDDEKIVPLQTETIKENHNIKILVVDDEKINTQVLLNQLSIQGYDVDIASNGIDALNIIERKEYDLILLDIMMPKMSGFDVCKVLREKYSIFELPILLLTAKNQVKDFVVGFEVGANDYVLKPFDKNELLARMKTLLSLKKAVKNAIESAQLANIDGLTGLNNRRHLFELSEREFYAAQRYERNLCVMMLDIDRFKDFNDTYGHDVGDEILKLVATTISQNTRVSDIIGRYGGEEFAIVMPEIDIKGAKVIGERIRQAIEDARLHTEKYGELKCTISIGIGFNNQKAQSIEELFKDADEMLYKAKKGGRNRVES